MTSTDYTFETKDWYQDSQIAERYRAYHTKGISWIRFMMWRQKRIIDRELKSLIRGNDSIIADFPCGTGLLANVLSRHPIKIIPLDISFEMLDSAKQDYNSDQTIAFACADVTKSPFRDKSLTGLLTIGLIHRLPNDIRENALKEMARITQDWIILTFSIDSTAQKLKRSLLNMIYPGYRAAPSPDNISSVETILNKSGFNLKKIISTFPCLSSDSICIFCRAT